MSAKIVSLEMLLEIVKLEGHGLVATSGGFDPLHVGHLSCIRESKELAVRRGCKLVVIVNGDGFLVRKKGAPFMSHLERMQIVAGLQDVDYVVGWDDGTQTVSGCLEKIKPRYFAKGGDRSSPQAVPELDVCNRIGCQIVYGVGGTEKMQSSSALLSKKNPVSSQSASNRAPDDLIKKPWGYEEIFVHTDRYVGKLIHIDDQKRLSRQYHELKDETIYVKSGELVLEINSPADVFYRQIVLRPGESFRIAPGVIHRFCALMGPVDVIEVSTPELDDVVRLSDDFGRS